MKSATRINGALAGAIALIAVGVAGLYWSFNRVERAAAVRQQNRVLVADAYALLSSVINAENGQRGYLLTGDSSFLGPFYSVRDSINTRLDVLMRNSTNRDSQQHLTVLSPLVAAKLQELSTLNVPRLGQDSADAQAMVRNSQSKRLMDSIRAEIRAFVDLEQASLAQHEATFATDLRNLFIGITAASALALLLTLALVYL
ncbi:MAG: CHASE3 domain-containing protein, partial [Gemmatimonas sp.]